MTPGRSARAVEPGTAVELDPAEVPVAQLRPDLYTVGDLTDPHPHIVTAMRIAVGWILKCDDALICAQPYRHRDDALDRAACAYARHPHGIPALIGDVPEPGTPELAPSLDRLKRLCRVRGPGDPGACPADRRGRRRCPGRPAPPGDELDTATQTAVDGLRGFGYAWADIACRLGTTRQAAQQRSGSAR